MREHLPALAAKICAALSIKPQIFITHPAELRILRAMSENELRKFAADRGWGIGCRLSAARKPVSGLVAAALTNFSASPISQASRPASTALRKACAMRTGSD